MSGAHIIHSTPAQLFITIKVFLAIVVAGFIAFFPPLLKGFLMKKIRKLIKSMLEEHGIPLK